MHAEMGRKSQAGFVDDETGVKVQGQSYVYEVQEVLEEAQKWGFDIEGDAGERAIAKADLESGVVGKRGEKWVGVKCWFGMVLKLKRQLKA